MSHEGHSPTQVLDPPVSSLVPLVQATMAPMLGWDVIPAMESTCGATKSFLTAPPNQNKPAPLLGNSQSLDQADPPPKAGFPHFLKPWQG